MTRVRAQFLGATIDRDALRFVFRDQRGPVGRDLDARSRRVLVRARSLAPKRSGRLLSTLRRETGQAPLGPYHDVVVGRPGFTDYLGYQLYGTTPHIILPVRRRALRFTSGGRIIFATKVNHPGTKPNNFLIRALNAAR